MSRRPHGLPNFELLFLGVLGVVILVLSCSYAVLHDVF